jgi:hypothetical protein
MTLVVEDGSGLSNAESYASVAEADARHSALGNTSWGDIVDKEVALRLATDYMLSTYRLRWRGFRTTSTQALDWPRSQVEKPDAVGAYGPWPSYYDDNEIPNEIKQACIDLALKTASGDLAPDLEPTEKRIKIGPIEIDQDVNSTPVTVFRAIEAKLRPFFKGAGNGVRLIRA